MVKFEIIKLGAGPKMKVYAVEATASWDGAANLASFREIIRIGCDDYVGIKWVSALPTIAIGIV